MTKTEIESIVATKLRKAAEEAISSAIRELNAAGHCFEPVGNTLTEWVEPGADESLNVTCAIGVGFTAPGRRCMPDPVVDSFIARAESGADRDATLLNMLEGDIANGGFLQLFENKRESFIRDGITLLRKIGARSSLRLIEQAMALIQEHRTTLEDCNALRKKLNRLDSRFWNLKENIPALYERYLQQSEKTSLK